MIGFHRCSAALATALVASSCAVGPAAEREAQPQVFEIVARGLTFEAPSQVASGWTTFRLVNASGMEHFALVQRLPEGIGIADHQAQIAPVFQQGTRFVASGDAEAAQAELAKLPEWYGGFVFLGGPGLVSGGRSTEVTMHLEPGTYLIECYVKTAGIFHSYSPRPGSYGMVRELTVTPARSNATPPKADLSVRLSRQGGIEMQGVPRAGAQTVAVHFVDQGPHENFVGHDLHLARLADGADLEKLARWMDWSDPEGLETPAPVTFVGGVNEMPAGETAYLGLRLDPGRYAWISEVPRPDEKGMLRVFAVQ